MIIEEDPQTKTSAMTLAYQLRQEGRQEGAAGAFVRLVRRKFPDVASQVAPVLERLDEEQLFSFGEALLFMQTPGECLEWLAGK
jgi:thioredoxin-like negative regulator of GroEL